MNLQPDSGDSNQQGWYSHLEYQLNQIPRTADRIVRKHWRHAEREQYPLWIGIIVFALLLFIWLTVKDISWISRNKWLGVWVSIIMLAEVLAVVFYHISKLPGRFARQWSYMTSDGEMFRFLSDAGLMLGYPVQFGKPDENFSTNLSTSFTETIHTLERYLKDSVQPDGAQPGSPAGLFIPSLALNKPSGGDSHRVYEAEYRGTIIRTFSIRVDSMDTGCRLTVGFTLRQSKAETRDALINSVTGRLEDRFIASKVLGDIREAAGIEAEPMTVVESQESPGGPATSQA